MDVKTIAVIGAGTTGRGIACAAALGGYRTILEDVMPENLAKGMAWIRQALDDGVARGRLAPGIRDAALRRMETARSIEDASREADFLIEAVPEEAELKLEIFTLFDKFARPAAVLASTTSAISIAELAAMTYRPEVCAGMRFVPPTPELRRVEIVRALRTSEETIAACCEAGRRMGLEVVVVKEPSGPVATE
ncbi:MAG TPA: 3-hydroxyacyl-CoA dehydrogenase family protein [Candidatus Acidoferrales bacterium]|nr:3-hydroxyacyl-CoA dehydrogenase family protein [Candidatus Acidoferrales bacterium]